MITKFRDKLKNNAGFTLVELIVVIAVLGILAGIAVPRLTGVQQSATRETLKFNANTLKRSIDMYIAETGDLPKDDSDNLDFSGSDYSLDFSTDDFHIGNFSASDGGTLGPNDYSITISESTDGGSSAAADGDSVDVTDQGISPSW